MRQEGDAISKKLGRVRLLLLDVDGVLTDGSIIYHEDGTETKVFNVKDGAGIRCLMDAGLKVGIVTGRSSGALRHRCKNLGIDLLFDGVRDKAAVLPVVVEQTGVPPEAIAFVGDDLPDIPLMRKVGLSIAVGDAHGMARDRADMIIKARGGAGAVREVCDAILSAQNLWEKIMERF